MVFNTRCLCSIDVPLFTIDFKFSCKGFRRGSNVRNTVKTFCKGNNMSFVFVQWNIGHHEIMYRSNDIVEIYSTSVFLKSIIISNFLEIGSWNPVKTYFVASKLRQCTGCYERVFLSKNFITCNNNTIVILFVSLQ